MGINLFEVVPAVIAIPASSPARAFLSKVLLLSLRARRKRLAIQTTHVDGVQAALALRYLELHPLSFNEELNTRLHLDLRKVNEYVRTLVHRNEAEALRFAKQVTRLI